MDLKALKLLLLLVGNEFRLRIPLGKLLVPQNPSAFLQKYKI